VSEKKEYIERGALLNDHLVEVDRDEGYEVFRPFIYADDLEMFPAADVEPVVRGEWIEFDEDMNAYSCSVCNEPQMFIDGNPEQNEYSFCPHCGAHMREKPNE